MPITQSALSTRRAIRREIGRETRGKLGHDPRRAEDSGNQGHPDEIEQARGLHLDHQVGPIDLVIDGSRQRRADRERNRRSVATVESAMRLDIDDMMQWGGIRAFARLAGEMRFNQDVAGLFRGPHSRRQLFANALMAASRVAT
jgi:hypothetical protein